MLLKILDHLLVGLIQMMKTNEYGIGINVYNHGRYGIRHITKKVLKTEYKVFDTRYRVEGRVERGVNYGPGIKEFGSPDAKGLTFEFSREQSPKGKYLVCIRMTQAYVDTLTDEEFDALFVPVNITLNYVFAK